MSEYYNPHRTRNLFNPDDLKPFKLSRSKIDAFLECPRCFYLDRRLGVARPPGFPFTLNSAVDTLLKKEFDGSILFTVLDKAWHDGYKRQMEIYQWLFRQNGFPVSDTGYFVYANGRANRDGFDGKLEFDLTLITYTGSSDWVEKAISDISRCLRDPKPPKSGQNCDYCAYTLARGEKL